jgi:prolyl 4-hydroxylase
MTASTSVIQPITDDLRRWIVAQAEAGCRPEDVLQAMKASGWDEAVAIAALRETIARAQGLVVDPLPTVTTEQEPARRLPEPGADGAPVVRLSDGHEVRVLASLRDPRIVVFGGLLTDAECVELMALAEPRLARSETVGTHDADTEVNVARTSDGMFFGRGEKPLIATLETRVAELLHWPMDHGEGLQILRYRPGAEYRPHYDFFDPAHAGTPRILQRGGQRLATLVIYLNTPTVGGATTFPDIGLEVAPVRGNAVFFSYARPHPGTRTLHGGAPVVEGEKWVATKWLREGIFV